MMARHPVRCLAGGGTVRRLSFRRVLALASFGALAGVLITPVMASYATLSPTRIVLRKPGGIFAMSPNTGRPARIRSQQNKLFAVAERGNLLAFVKHSPPSRFHPRGFDQIYLLDGNGEGNARRVGAQAGERITSIAVSPNGGKVAYTKALRFGTEIYYFTPAQPGIQTNFSTAPDEEGLSFSPDGKHLIFSSAVDQGSDLFSIDLYSDRLRRITHDAGAEEDPVYSPNGRLIAYICQLNGGRSGLCTARGDGTRERVVLSGDSYANPDFSPSGRSIVFESGEAVYTVRAVGGGLHRQARGFSDPNWVRR
jgi:WD40 repeat protein